MTKTIVDQLSPGQTVWDAKVRGFGVRCQVFDKSYVLKTTVKGRQRYVTIGIHGSPWTLEMARREATILLGDLREKGEASDHLPSARKRLTVSEICDKYLTEYAHVHKKKSSAYSDQRMIENHIRPLIGRMPVREVTRADILNLQRDVHQGKTASTNPQETMLAQRGGKPVTGGPGVSNRTVRLLSKIFNLAEEWDLRDQATNPASRIKLFKETPKERHLSQRELGALAGC